MTNVTINKNTSFKNTLTGEFYDVIEVVVKIKINENGTHEIQTRVHMVNLDTGNEPSSLLENLITLLAEGTFITI